MHRALGAGLLLFVLNVFICAKLATIEYLRAMHSIEGAYIGISRYVIENWGDLTWFPTWYAGIPFQNSYPPLLHMIVAGVAWLGRISPASSYHIVETVLYALGPAALCWLAARWSGSLGCGMLAGAFYSLVSPSAFLISNVRDDLGSLFNMRRLHTIVYYGDAPYVSALALVPLALLSLDVALAKRRPATYLLAAVAMAAVVLTNWLGAAALALGVLAYLLGHAESRRAWPATLGIAALAYALASPWIRPSTLRAIQFNAQTIGGDFQMTWRNAGYAAVLVSAAAAVVLLCRKLKLRPHAGMALAFLIFTGGITLSAEWAGIFLVPQPQRYHQAMDMAVSLALACCAWPLLRRMPFWAKTSVAVMALVLCIGQAYHLRRYAEDLIQPIDIRTTTEYKTAHWFDRNMAGRRVMAPGSTSLFMNAFTSTPQLGGGFDQGVTNWYVRIAIYTIYSGQNAGAEDAEISLLWLKAFGVDAIAVGGPGSGEHYKPFVNPRKFVGLLPEIWRDGDDYIYRVPRRLDSLAHVVRRGDIVSRPPIHGLDVDQLRRYVAALEDPAFPVATLDWTSRHSARIQAKMEQDQLLSFQITYHPGWHAVVNGEQRPVRADGIGLMTVEPRCAGACTIDLVYDGGTEMKLARNASFASLAGCLAWIISSRRRKRGTGV